MGENYRCNNCGKEYPIESVLEITSKAIAEENIDILLNECKNNSLQLIGEQRRTINGA